MENGTVVMKTWKAFTTRCTSVMADEEELLSLALSLFLNPPFTFLPTPLFLGAGKSDSDQPKRRTTDAKSLTSYIYFHFIRSQVSIYRSFAQMLKIDKTNILSKSRTN